MKLSFILLLLITSFAVHSQNMFFRQSDHSTNFGINVEGASTVQETRIAGLMGVKYIRDAISLCTWNSGDGIDAGIKGKSDSGFKVVLNINWDGNCQGAGLKMFPAGAALTSFSTKLDAFLAAGNAQYIWVAVIENEPFNRGYYNYSTSPNGSPPYTNVKDYLGELQAAVTICHRYGVKIADGASHLDYYQKIIDGKVGGDPERRADSAWHLYSNSYDKLQLDYNNCHYQAPSGITNVTDDGFDPDIIKTLCDYQTSVTHHKVISNEWHQEDANGTLTQAKINSLDTSGVTRARQAHMPINIPFSGPGDPGQALSFTNAAVTGLSTLGTTFKNAVASGQ